MPEIIEAFNKSDSEFQEAYGFQKPQKTINLVVGCLSGRRAAAGAEQLVQLGFSSVQYDIYLFRNIYRQGIVYSVSLYLSFFFLNKGSTRAASVIGEQREDLFLSIKTADLFFYYNKRTEC